MFLFHFFFFFFFFNDTATTEIYTLSYTLSLHDALPICQVQHALILFNDETAAPGDCCRSEEHTSELQSHSEISYAVFCLKKTKYITCPIKNQVTTAAFTGLPQFPS